MNNEETLLDLNDAVKSTSSQDEKPLNISKPAIAEKPLDISKTAMTEATVAESNEMLDEIPIHEVKPQYINKESRSINWKPIGFWTVIIIGAFLLGFAIVNGPAIGMKISQWFKSIQGKINYQEEIYSPSTQVSNDQTSSSGNILADNHLIIPKINVDAPIQWDINPADVNRKLTDGLVHYEGTAHPDQSGGNVFITGHSSNFWWVKSDYNQVFALLGDLEIGDRMIVTYQSKKYVYQVYDKFVVDPNQVEVLNSVEGKSTLSLMSCVPIGTNLKRLIIRSELQYIDTAPSQTEPQTTTNVNQETNEPTAGSEKPDEQQQTPSQTTSPSSDLFLPGV